MYRSGIDLGKNAHYTDFVEWLQTNSPIVYQLAVDQHVKIKRLITAYEGL